MRSNTRAAIAVLGAVFVAFTATGTALADEKRGKRVQLPQQVPDTGVAINGRATAPGQLKKLEPQEEAALIEELVEMTSEDDAGLTTERMADGTEMIDLEGRFQSATIAIRQLDGTIGFTCQTGKGAVEAAKHAVGDKKHPVSHPAALEEM